MWSLGIVLKGTFILNHVSFDVTLSLDPNWNEELSRKTLRFRVTLLPEEFLHCGVLGDESSTYGHSRWYCVHFQRIQQLVLKLKRRKEGLSTHVCIPERNTFQLPRSLPDNFRPRVGLVFHLCLSSYNSSTSGWHNPSGTSRTTTWGMIKYTYSHVNSQGSYMRTALRFGLCMYTIVYILLKNSFTHSLKSPQRFRPNTLVNPRQEVSLSSIPTPIEKFQSTPERTPTTTESITVPSPLRDKRNESWLWYKLSVSTVPFLTTLGLILSGEKDFRQLLHRNTEENRELYREWFEVPKQTEHFLHKYINVHPTSKVH